MLGVGTRSLLLGVHPASTIEAISVNKQARLIQRIDFVPRMIPETILSLFTVLRGPFRKVRMSQRMVRIFVKCRYTVRT